MEGILIRLNRFLVSRTLSRILLCSIRGRDAQADQSCKNKTLNECMNVACLNKNERFE